MPKTCLHTNPFELLPQIPALPSAPSRWKPRGLAAALMLALVGQASAQVVTVDSASRLAKVKRVAITQLVVQCIDRQNGKAAASGFAGGAAASLDLKLDGPGVEQCQHLADALYDEVVKTMTSAGVEVVPHEKLAALPAFADVQKAGKPSPKQEEALVGYGGWMVSPRGMTVLLDRDDEESFMQSNRDPDPRGEVYRAGGSQFAEAFSLGGLRQGEDAIAEALDAHVLKVRVTVPLAVIEKSGGFLSGGASVKMKSMPRLARDVTRFTFRRDGSSSRIRLDEHMLLPAEMATLETVEEKKDNGSLSLSAAFGMRSSSTASGVYRMVIDPQRYETEVLAASKATFARFGQTLEAKRAGD